MKLLIFHLGLCATLLSNLNDWLIRRNFIQVVKKEKWDPITQKYQPYELWPERFNPERDYENKKRK